MRNISTAILLFACVLSTEAQKKQSKKEPIKEQDAPRIKRSEAFFGIHLDFHVNENDNKIGEGFRAETADSLLKIVKPDYLQVDTKGHQGFSCYPTKVGIPAPGFVKDPMRIWRDVTAKNGVALIAHFSGVYDVQAIKAHPEWARINEKGEKDPKNTSVFGAYVDQSMIPQLKELSKEYKLDGVWVDGDGWCMEPDYSEAALKAFREKTGITNVPRSPEDPNYKEMLEFTRVAFRNYLRHYTDALHAFDPKFQINSNWAFSSRIPEPVDVKLDFLSGDLPPNNCFRNAEFDARGMAKMGLPWELMSWSFFVYLNNPIKTRSAKSDAQLHQEVAATMAMGGGVSVYYNQNHDATIQPNTIPSMKNVGEFCRARQPYCHRAVAVPQIGLYYSIEGQKKKSNNVYKSWIKELDPLHGNMNALLDGQNAVEILMDQHLKGNIQNYPLIVVPEWAYIKPESKEEILNYVNKGGNLIVVGPDAVKLFEKELGISIDSTSSEKNRFLLCDNLMQGFLSPISYVKLKEGTTPFFKIYKSFDIRTPEATFASIRLCGKGKIAGVYTNLGTTYNTYHNFGIKQVLDSLVNTLFTNPMVKVQGSNYVHMTVNKLADKLTINLVNSGGPHQNKMVFSYDAIPAVGPLNLSIISDKKPSKIMLQPEGKELQYSYQNGTISLTVPKVDIHSIVVVE